ncbi:succinyl-diaminopimelate desuccinylase [Roseomonas alkaliterrae]|uniref:Succinyl-diaminopimelate desuccinylase n=1 Tax=Neoroseomonas alkaliterrae TaxID=1452450 RepID=A0A840XQE6_9PROT|nr:succinyl-diaminopimelate desuccinylase [Neoroseomonas alkaliterrae]MBB5688919.1 succinyl-diaminopimelate desuccinylase [Neoroseomonas alkaliterrae]MBR0677882.1 succinyl-diaminopimelate desuccinylase [Neoroseomonas alkaliterrae]
MATDPIPLAQALIRCRSVTPADDGALDVVQRALEPLGFACTRLTFGPDDYRVGNLFARRGGGGPHLCYAGHTDVVPPGDLGAWSDDPFGGVVRDGLLFGRGACDMKGGIAAFIAGLTDYLAARPDHPGSISLLITGDEEARSVDGTAKVLEWMQAEGKVPDMALVGEPTSRRALGDTIKIGRRGSLTARIAVQGRQGHSAYPAQADNPIHRLVAALGPLLAAPLDNGSEFFPPSTLQVTGFDVGNAASNVIPAQARAMLNIRFNDLHTSEALTERLHAALRAAGCAYEMQAECSGESFLTRPGPFVEALSRAIARSTGVEPALDTGGGTSDARFIARYCPVAEFGAVGATLHQVNEHAPVEELRRLAAAYRAVLEEILG